MTKGRRASVITPPKNIQPRDSANRGKRGGGEGRKKESSPVPKEKKRKTPRPQKTKEKSDSKQRPRKERNRKRTRSVSTPSVSSSSSSESSRPRKRKQQRSDTTASLSKEMYSSLKGRSRFSHVTKEHFTEAAKLFAKFGFLHGRRFRNWTTKRVNS